MDQSIAYRLMPRTAPDTQRAILITAPGEPAVLRFMQGLPVPAPEPDELLIRVVAAGVNRHDCNQRRRGPAPDQSDVPGLEVSGYIVDCGRNISRQRIGEAVMALTDGGGYGEYVLAHSDLTFDCPATVDLVGAAGLPEGLFTTWLNFFTLMDLQPGESVLIHGGASGVGT